MDTAVIYRQVATTNDSGETSVTPTAIGTVTAEGEVTVIEIMALALRAATDACQVGFNKAVIRVLIQRQMSSNRLQGGR